MALPLLDSCSVNGTIMCVAFCVCLLSLSIMFSRFIHTVAHNSTALLFNGWIVFHRGYTAFYLHTQQVINIWFVSTSWLLWICCFVHPCSSFCVDIQVCFQFSWVYIGMELSHTATIYLTFWGIAELFQSSGAFTFLPGTCEGSNFFIFLPTLVIFCLFDDSHPCGREVWYLTVFWFVSPWWLMWNVVVVFTWFSDCRVVFCIVKTGYGSKFH